MARPLSEAKHDAILAAAARIVAAEGLGAPTARIAREAGVAEGSLFRYFPTKDALLNALYAAIKAELAAAVLDGYPAAGSVEERLRHVWFGYIRWGLKEPAAHKAMAQLSVSNRISEETQEAAGAALAEIDVLLRGCLRAETGLSPAFAGALLMSMAETTIGFMASDPERAEETAEAGFRSSWRSIGGT